MQSAIDISESSISDKEIPTHVNSNPLVTDLMPEFVRTGYPLIHLQDTEDSRMMMKKKNRKVSPISVEEERVREALGIPSKVNTQADLSSLYNTSFAGDRERNMMVKFSHFQNNSFTKSVQSSTNYLLPEWSNTLADSSFSLSSPLESSYSSSSTHSSSSLTSSISSVENIPDQR